MKIIREKEIPGLRDHDRDFAHDSENSALGGKSRGAFFILSDRCLFTLFVVASSQSQPSYFERDVRTYLCERGTSCVAEFGDIQSWDDFQIGTLPASHFDVMFILTTERLRPNPYH